MPSPFPGMDPYLEDPAFWSDLHGRFLASLADALSYRLPENYEARLHERIVLEELDSSSVIEPDVAVPRSQPSATEARPRSAVRTLLPRVIPLLMLDEPRQLYIEVTRRPKRELVTVIELLSPSNKAGSGRLSYLTKRNSLAFQEEVNIVELDLLLGGQRLPMNGPLPAGHYYAFVSRGDRRPDCEVYAWTLDQPLPNLPVPLRIPDPDIWISLGELFIGVYDRARYAPALAYDSDPPVPLPERVRSWVIERAQSVRGS